MPTKYLVAVDGSPASTNALRYAIKLASQTGADLAAVYVVMPRLTFEGGIEPPSSFTDTGQGLLQSVEDVETYGQAVLEEAEELAERRGFALETGMLEGNPDEEIATFANEYDYDAVFVGHVDLEPEYESLFGSVAKDLVGLLERPVIVLGA